MKEQDFLTIIKQQIGDKFIGDDCAYLKEFGLVISQDNFVEDVHFKRKWYSPFQLGYKAISINISDILASGARPDFVSIGLSLPKDIDANFIEEFYLGTKKALCGAKIIGGDITGSGKIFISVTVLGSVNNRNISSRKNAKKDYVVITKGIHGASAAGLKALMENDFLSKWIKYHLEPTLEVEFANTIATIVKEPYAMMDSSDGLADALFKIAEASNVKIIADINKIQENQELLLDDVLFGGEDYKLVAAIPEKYLNQIPGCIIIGKVVDKTDDVILEVGKNKYSRYDELGVFNHFGE